MKQKTIVAIVSVVAFFLTGCSSSSETPEVTSHQSLPTEIKESASKELRQLFAEKYPKYAKTLSVRIDQETQDHARGGVIFEAGAPGGIFLATKIDGKWEIVRDGNGEIPCDLSKYGFPAEMLRNCAE